MNERELMVAIDESVRERFSARNGAAWYRKNEDVVQVIEVQKSQWGGQYYLNCGLFIRSLGTATKPRERHAHLRTRFAKNLHRGLQPFESALDLENTSIGDAERVDTITTTVHDIVLPWLDEHLTLSQLRDAYERGSLSRLLVTKQAKALLHQGRDGQH